MDYQQALKAYKCKKALGLVVGILALVSMIVSLMKFLYLRMNTGTELGAVLAEPYKNLITTLYEHTSYLNLFWEYSPVPDLTNIMTSGNFFFLVIYMFFFIALALEASGNKLASYLSQKKGELDVATKEAGSDVINSSELIGIRVSDQRRELFILPAIVLTVAVVVLKTMGF